MMSYWECSVHQCGSTRFNNLSRHEMPWCDIVKRTGIPLQNTWHDEMKGGLNGDLSRKFYRDWDAFCLEKQQLIQKKNNWERQLKEHEEFIDVERERLNKWKGYT
mgnify:CR=1 FL=1